MTIAPRFDTWLDDFFAVYYRHLPVNATFIGVHGHDDRLPDWSASGRGDFLADIASLQERLTSLPVYALRETQRIDRKVAAGFLEIQRWELESAHLQCGNPALYTGEAIFGVMGLFLRDLATAEQRAESAIQRMEGVATFLTQAKESIHDAPLPWIERALNECEGALNFFGDGIDRLVEQHDFDANVRSAADQAAQAFADFAAWLKTDLSQHPRQQVGAGAEALDLHICNAHFLPQSADEMVRYAEAVFAEQRAKLEEGAADFGVVTWQGALAQLADHHPASTADYYQQYDEVWQACRELAVEHDLVTWETLPLRYVPRPAWARSSSPYLYFLFYRAPAAFNRAPTVEYLVEPIEPDMPPDEQARLLRATNDSVIKLNHVVHHGGLGHHAQNTRAGQSESRVGQMAAVDCASRIAMLSGGTMAEGWSCYTTELVNEFGFLTALEAYAEHYARLRMAARTIVDVKLHRGDFSFAQAVDFYQQQVGMSAAAAHGEATKNSMFPGGALMYLLGTDAIHDLRRELSAQRGEAFSLRQFHDQFLSHGSLPVSLIAETMRRDR